MMVPDGRLLPFLGPVSCKRALSWRSWVKSEGEGRVSSVTIDIMSFIKCAVPRVFGSYGIGLDKALWKSDIGARLGFPEMLAQEDERSGRRRKGPGMGRRAQNSRGVRGRVGQAYDLATESLGIFFMALFAEIVDVYGNQAILLTL